MKMPLNLRIGKLGEEIAERYLRNKGFTIIGRNFLRKWGEIDIICKKEDIVHFVEVKTVSQRTFSQSSSDEYRPEDNLHQSKATRLKRVIETYIDENDLEEDYCIDLITVKIIENESIARVKMFRDVIL